MHYSDDDEVPPRGRAAEDDDLVGPRRGARPRDPGEDDLVGPRRGAGARRQGARVLDDQDDAGPPARRPRSAGRRGADRENASLMDVVRDIPRYLKLLARLARDPRVSKVDKALVAAVLVYLVSPIDLVPDWVVPVVGQIEDVYLLALALSRLVNNAGMDVLLDHWDGDPAALQAALEVLDRASALLPGPVRSLLGARA